MHPIDRLFLLHAPEMADMARQLRAKASFPTEIVPIEWDEFADGFPNHRITESLYGKDVCFLASFHSPDAIQRQLGIVYAIPRYGARSLRVIVPYFPGTMERVRREGEIATAKTIARQISATPMCRGSGPAEFVFYDIHQLGEWFYFGDGVNVRLASAIPMLKEWMARNGLGPETASVLFPDDGARKRFGDDFPEYLKIVCAKVRLGSDGSKVTIMEGSPTGRAVVVVDDLIQRGTTLVESGRAARLQGAHRVVAFATHFVGPAAAENSLADSRVFSYIVVTDSHPSSARLVGRDPFHVLPLAPSLIPLVRDE